jgi:spore coat polysaccharide biosynthesis protein SpsF (cytidylyltransferase family)
MKKKYWFLLLLLGIFIFGYIKLFYSSINKAAVPSNADMVASIDVKKVIRTVVWDIVTHTSKWKIKSSSIDTTDIVDIKDVFVLPDYAQAFHVKGEPTNAWYTVLQIKDEALFTKALKQYGFTTLYNNQYTSIDKKLGISKNGNEIIVSSFAPDSTNNLNAIANTLFVKKDYLPTEKLEQITNANSHIALFVAANKFLQKDAIVKGNITNDNIILEGELIPKEVYSFIENNFAYSSNALLSMGFTQPTTTVYNAIGVTDKANISKSIGVSMDSLFMQSNKYYQLQVDGIVPRVDSAITYTYDDDFNAIQKVVVNNVDEPMYNFVVVGDSVQTILNNWTSNKTIVNENNGQLFRPMPLVKSFCTIKDKSTLEIAPKNFTKTSTNENIKAVFFANIIIQKIGDKYLKYFPDDVKNTLQKVSKANIACTKIGNTLVLKATIEKAAKGFLDFD